MNSICKNLRTYFYEIEKEKRFQRLKEDARDYFLVFNPGVSKERLRERIESAEECIANDRLGLAGDLYNSAAEYSLLILDG